MRSIVNCPIFLAATLAVACESTMSLVAAEVAAPKAALSVKLDRTEYRQGESMLLIADFVPKSTPRTSLQFSNFGSGTAYFYLILESSTGAVLSCEPFSSLQFLETPETFVESISQWLEKPPCSTQLLVYGAHLKDLAPGSYRLRVAYAVDVKLLRERLLTMTGKKWSVDGFRISVLPKACRDVIVSEPVTLKIVAKEIAGRVK